MDCNKYFYSIVFVVLGSVFSFGQIEEKLAPVTVPTIQVEADTYDENVPYPIAVVTEVPRIEGCAGVSESEAIACLYEQIQKHVKKYLNYPKEAKELGIQGKVAVVFIIDKEGNCKDFKARGTKNGHLLEEEALRIMKLLPKLTPGKMKGKLVNVHYAVPIVFSIE